MSWQPWDRERAISSIRSDIWTVVSPTAQPAQTVLEASALLQLEPDEARALGRLHFLLSPEVHDFLESMPRLARRLATTTVVEEERHPERIRGAIDWGATVAQRATSGSRYAFVTRPARRAYQTPENELLVHVLDAVPLATKRLPPWAEDSRYEGAAQSLDTRDRVAAARSASDRWRSLRALSTVERRPPDERRVHRVRA